MVEGALEWRANMIPYILHDDVLLTPNADHDMERLSFDPKFSMK